MVQHFCTHGNNIKSDGYSWFMRAEVMRDGGGLSVITWRAVWWYFMSSIISGQPSVSFPVTWCRSLGDKLNYNHNHNHKLFLISQYSLSDRNCLKTVQINCEIKGIQGSISLRTWTHVEVYLHTYQFDPTIFKPCTHWLAVPLFPHTPGPHQGRVSPPLFSFSPPLFSFSHPLSPSLCSACGGGGWLWLVSAVCKVAHASALTHSGNLVCSQLLLQ